MKKIKNVFNALYYWGTFSAKERTVFKWLVGLFCVYVFPIVLANVYYIDDLGRALNGSAWTSNGRPFAGFIMSLIEFGKPLADISPLTQFLSVLMLAYALVLWARKYILKENLYVTICCLFLCIANPFFLENLSYKFDSLPMTLAVSLCLLAFSLPDSLSKKKEAVCVGIAVMLTLSLYQAALGMYLCFIAIESMVGLVTKKDLKYLIKKMLFRGVVIGGASVLYKITIAQRFVGKDGYNAVHSQMILPVNYENIQIIIYNCLSFFDLIKEYVYSIPIGGKVVISLVCIWALVLIFTSYVKYHRSHKIGSAFFLLLSICIIIFGSFLPLLLLKVPIIAPRTLISACSITLWIGLLITYLSHKKKIVTLLFVPMIVFAFSYSYVYGNVLHKQSEGNIFIAKLINVDLSQLNYNGNIKNVTIIGNAPETKEYQFESKKYPLMKRLVPIYMRGGWFWGYKILDNYSFNKYNWEEEKKADKSFIETQKAVRENSIYEIYIDGNRAIISFR